MSLPKIGESFQQLRSSFIGAKMAHIEKPDGVIVPSSDQRRIKLIGYAMGNNDDSFDTDCVRISSIKSGHDDGGKRAAVEPRHDWRQSIAISVQLFRNASGMKMQNDPARQQENERKQQQ